MKVAAGIIIGIFLAVVLEAVAEQIYMHSRKYKESLGGAWKLQKPVPKQLEIVNIGSGPGLYAITYEHSSKRGFNFSTAPQNYKYGFRLLKRFSEHLCANCIIIIIVMCPLSFGNNDDYARPGYSDKFYGVLTPQEIDEYSWKRAWMVRHPLLQKVLRKLCIEMHAFCSKCKDGIFRRQEKRPAGQEMENHQEQGKEFVALCGQEAGNAQEPEIVRIWKQEFQLQNLTEPSQAERHKIAFAEKRRIICEGIDRCYDKSWRPVFVIPPVPPKTRDYVGEAFLQAFVYDNLEKLQNRYPKLPLLDYYKDERFDTSMFQNDIFVNEAGRKRFSEILFSDISKYFSED